MFKTPASDLLYQNRRPVYFCSVIDNDCSVIDTDCAAINTDSSVVNTDCSVIDTDCSAIDYLYSVCVEFAFLFCLLCDSILEVHGAIRMTGLRTYAVREAHRTIRCALHIVREIVYLVYWFSLLMRKGIQHYK